MLGLIRRYLEAGVMDGGLVAREQGGDPSGFSVSPLLSNIMLDDLDWELERRGHRFVRFADDGVSTSKARGRASGSWRASALPRAAPEAAVNRQKSAVALAVERPLLGFQFFRDRPARSARSPRRLSNGQGAACAS